MEPFAGAWSADEPMLDFGRLTTQRPAAPARAGGRVTDANARTWASVPQPISWSPFALVDNALTADTPSGVAALMAAPLAGSEPADAAVASSSAGGSVEGEDRVPPSETAETGDPSFAGVAADDEHTPEARPARAVAATEIVAADQFELQRSSQIVPAERLSTIRTIDPTPPRAVIAAAPDATPAVTRPGDGPGYTSSTTTYAADGSVVSIDLYGFARTFDHVRLDFRADGTLATRTLLDTDNPAAAIVLDYDDHGARVARHEIDLPGRPYARVDILYGAEGWAETRMRSGFATGDLVSITVRYDAPGTIAQVEHLHVDGTRLTVGTAAAQTLAGHGGDVLAGRGGADTVVVLDADPRALVVADFHRSEGDRVDLSPLLGQHIAHVLGAAAFDGAADAVRFERVGHDALLSVDIDGDTVADATVLLSGVHVVHPGDLGM